MYKETETDSLFIEFVTELLSEYTVVNFCTIFLHSFLNTEFNAINS